MNPQSDAALLSLTDPRSVAVYDTYADAQKAVDYLAEHDFPVERLAIVGTDLKSIERVTGRLTWGKVLVMGAISGVMWGLALAVLLWIFVPGHSLFIYLLWGLVFGVVYGVLASAVQYALARGQRDFSSKQAVIATHYEILGESDVFAKARSLLGENPLAWRAPTGNTAMQPAVKTVPPVASTTSSTAATSTLPSPVSPSAAGPAAPQKVAPAASPTVPLISPPVQPASPAVTMPAPDPTLYPHLAAALGKQAAEVPERFRFDLAKDDTDPHGIGPVKPADSPTFVGKLDLGEAQPPKPSGPRRAG